RENADNRLYGTLGHLKSLQDRRPHLQIAVAGCLAQKDQDEILRRAPYVNVVFGTHNVGRSVDLLAENQVSGRSVLEILESPVDPEDAFAHALPVDDANPHSAWVTIQVGCDNSCAYCIVPAVRGPEQSRPFGALVDEVAALAKTGTFEVILLGQNVNSYGRDLTTALRTTDAGAADTELVGPEWVAEDGRRPRALFADLLRAVGAIEGVDRVRFTSPHPKDLRDDVIAAMAETPAVCEHLHLPVQSGSDVVLRAMRRGYTAARYLDRLEAARRSIDDLAVTTDIIVGFPGETEDDFEATLALAAEAAFDSAFTFIFSPRPGTQASELVDSFVPEEVIADRFARLKLVVDRSALLANERRVGGREEVVVEGISRKDAAVLSGRTRQGKLAHFHPGEHRFVPGDRATIHITSAGAHHLSGELVERGAPTRRRASIPLAVSSS
ncbi:MAG TPA: MiaB/RimO family radical SAM methylthiotransferase, partial [Acidimicrobiales bacterium]|nr:MiaB/RimO family radical SAM methylthiotransferase [Acidimicrobiales bacterium]